MIAEMAAGSAPERRDAVWVVDDDRSIRWVLEKALAREGIPYKSFASAYEVMQALALTRPQVLVSDIRMPGESGLALLNKAKERYPDMPVIIMTAYSDLDSAVARPDGSLVVWGDGTLNPVVYISLTGVTQVALGHGIDLVLGQSAFATVPDLTGDSTQQAGAELRAAGLVLGTVSSTVDDSCNNIGTVLGQSPHAGTTVRTGSAVSITIGTKPKNPCP